jgi:SAM-dependent methyltransferase
MTTLATRAGNFLKKRHLMRRVHAAGRSADLRTLFRDVPDDVWIWAFTDGAREHPGLSAALPSMPHPDIQERFTGASGDSTLREAFRFSTYVRRAVSTHGRPVTDVLDFGCGWGRVTRFFLRDVEASRLVGVDCMPAAIDLARTHNRHARFQAIDPFPPLRFDDGTFDLVYAYSVFSHLSEAAHLAWLREFRRVLRPGGIAVLTTRRREFIQIAADARRRVDTSIAMKGAVSAFHDTAAALARYDAGEFVFDPCGGGDDLAPSFYGESCIPDRYISRVWGQMFTIRECGYQEDVCNQVLIVARKE